MNIYKITNKVNGMVYIGSTKYELSDKFENYHLKLAWTSKHKSALHQDLIKYGYLNFSIDLLETLDVSDYVTLNSMILKWIQKFSSELGSDKIYNQESKYQTDILTSEILLIKEVLSFDELSVSYYQIGEDIFVDKSKVLNRLNELGIDISLSILNLITGNHMVPKSITTKYPNFKFIDNSSDTPTKYYYE